MEELLKKYFNRTITPQEFKNLEKWIDESSNNREQFHAMVRANYLSIMLNQDNKMEHKKAYSDMIAITNRMSSRRRIFRRTISVAAALLVSLVSYFTINWMISGSVGNRTTIVANNLSNSVQLTIFDSNASINNIDSSSVISRVDIDRSVDDIKKMRDENLNDRVATILSIKVPAKLDHKITLEDGTKVWINSDSELIYPSHFGDKIREVSIIGEGYFEVAKDATRPFIVKTANGSVRVLGTTFNVNAYPESSTTSTTLVTGKVMLSSQVDSVVMNPGQKAVIDLREQKIEVKECNIDREIAWIGGKYYFDGKPLEDILHILSRWYDVSFSVLNETNRQLTFTGMIDKNIPLTEVIEMLIETVNFKYVINDSNNIEIICN